MKNLIQRLQAHGRADELNALVEDTKRLRHSERQAVEAAQTALMDAAKAVEAQAAEITRLRDALAGLVACKTMKDDLDLRMQKDTMSAADQSVWFALAAEYASRKASAWDAAHAALLQDSKRT